MHAIILSAGQGSRLLPLTREMPKCLVEVGGRAIIDHQLAALAAAGIARAIVVGGYRIAQLDAHLRKGGHPLATELVLNPFWAVGSSIGSVWAARSFLDAPFLLLNGDTLFDPAILRGAAAAARPGVSLLVEPIDHLTLDDMLVAVADGAVCDVRKDLPADRATHRSLGAVLSTGDARYAAALERVIGGDDGVHAFHHAVVAELARAGGVHAIVAAPGARWQEIDRADDIAAWRGAHAGAARPR